MLRCLSDGRPLSVVEKAKNERARSEFTLGSPSKSPFSHSSRRKSAQTPSKTGGRLGPITSKMRFEETLALTPASPTRGGEHAQFQGIFTPFGVALLHVDDLLAMGLPFLGSLTWTGFCPCVECLSPRKSKPPPRPRWWRGRRSVPGFWKSPSGSGSV